MKKPFSIAPATSSSARFNQAPNKQKSTLNQFFRPDDLFQLNESIILSCTEEGGEFQSNEGDTEPDFVERYITPTFITITRRINSTNNIVRVRLDEFYAKNEIEEDRDWIRRSTYGSLDGNVIRFSEENDLVGVLTFREGKFVLNRSRTSTPDQSNVIIVAENINVINRKTRDEVLTGAQKA